MRNEAETKKAINKYADTVMRVCSIYLKNRADAEDVFQNVFLKYVLSSVSFENDEHEKAWIIRVTVNACKDLLKSFFRSKTVSLDEAYDSPVQMTDTTRQVIDAMMALPEKYKDAVYLHYYEGYTAPEIGKMLGKNVNTVYTAINRGGKLLRDRLGGDAYD